MQLSSLLANEKTIWQRNFTALSIINVLLMCAGVFFLASQVQSYFHESGMSDWIGFLNILLIPGFIVILGSIQAQSIFFHSNDNPFLMSSPVRNMSFFLFRIIQLYVWNLTWIILLTMYYLQLSLHTSPATAMFQGYSWALFLLLFFITTAPLQTALALFALHCHSLRPQWQRVVHLFVVGLVLVLVWDRFNGIAVPPPPLRYPESSQTRTPGSVLRQ